MERLGHEDYYIVAIEPGHVGGPQAPRPQPASDPRPAIGAVTL